jgi:hypothetical protein
VPGIGLGCSCELLLADHLAVAAFVHNEDSMAQSHLYKIIFFNQGKVYEIYAHSVSQGSLFGFIEVDELVFGERTTVVVDPAEERLKTEFETVKRTYIPMHAIVRIDEVEKQGVSKISSVDGTNVSQFPIPVYTPGGPGGES